MKTLYIDDELYHYIASQTQLIGESASDILRRMLGWPDTPEPLVLVQETMVAELKELARPLPSRKPIRIDLEGTVEHLEEVLKSDAFVEEAKIVGRFLMILAALYRSDSESFSRAAEANQGRERLYFARDEATLLASGNSIKAKPIPGCPFWVNTNNNTARKGIILATLMDSMQLPSQLIERIKPLFA